MAGYMKLDDGTSNVSFSPQIAPGINRPDQRNKGVHQYDGGLRQYWDTGGGRRDTFTLKNVSKAKADLLNQWWQNLTILIFTPDLDGAPGTTHNVRLNPAGGRPFQFTFGQTVDTIFEAVVTIPEVSSSSSST
jgi:hypothetical protein